MRMNTNTDMPRKGAGRVLPGLIAVLVSMLLTLGMLVLILGGTAGGGTTEQAAAKLSIMEKYDMYMTNAISDALEGIVTIEKVYWLSDDDLVAPEPNPDCYGETTDPASLQWLIDEAADLLDGQELIFRTDVTLFEGSKIKYYLDETILAITWKQKIGYTIYTFSEVKIRHPSQFRRFLSGGEYGSGILYTTTEMAKSVNAVTASSADYYAYRPFGNTVYAGTVKRCGDRLLDTCYVDENSNLLFVPRNQMFLQEDIEKYIEENHIRFSLAFGPVLIHDDVPIENNNYSIGETGDFYSRAALCQQGELHYMMVTANEGGVDMMTFARHMMGLGVHNVYVLDGGQTATIVTGDELMNDVDYGGEREISDIIYFATAVPSGG